MIADIATPEWITMALSQAGRLQKGTVESVSSIGSAHSPLNETKVAFLSVRYSNEAEDYAPSKLVLKVANGVKEHVFFSKIAPMMNISLVANCYYTEYNPKNQQSYFLLEDLSDTHFQPEWPVPPATQACKNAVDCLAKIHGFWWEHQSLKGELSDQLALGTSWNDRIELAISNIVGFFDFMQDRLSRKRRKLYENALASSNQMWRPGLTKNGLTLLHGDAHLWNFLYPKKENLNQTCIIDWNAWDIGRSTDDLAYMIGLHWYPERRSQFEKQLLHQYHSQLKNYTPNYKWDEFWNDYRESAILCLFIPVWQWCKGIPPAIWWSHLERGFLTFEDLGCEEMLQM